MCHLYPAHRSSHDGMPTLAPVSATVCGFNEELLALLTKPEPLTAAEWAWVEAVTGGED